MQWDPHFGPKESYSKPTLRELILVRSPLSSQTVTSFALPVGKACVSLKLIIITRHSQSTKHKQSKERLKVKEKQIADKSVQHNDRMHFRGETLPQEQQVYHIKVVTAFLKAGVPLNKINSFRDILEENAYRLTDR